MAGCAEVGLTLATAAGHVAEVAILVDGVDILTVGTAVETDVGAVGPIEP